MKVMMIQLPHFYGGNKRPSTLYPLGIGYLVSLLKSRYDLIPMDLWIEDADIDKAMRLISKSVPDVFCISVYSTQYPYFKELATSLKRVYPNIKIIAGGPGATFSYQVFLEKTLVDFCIIGEGEITLGELLDRINKPEEVKGIAYRKNGVVVLNPKREQISDLDALPLPDRTFFDIERYIVKNKKEGGPYRGLRTANIIAGRGCSYTCTFCSKTFARIRLRSIEKIEEEIRHIKESYNLNAIDFNDELVVINKKRILELCSTLRGLDIKWGCQGRINLVDEEILTAMRNAQCLYIGYGVEAVSQRILDKMKKQIKAEDIVPAIKMTKRVGLNFILQYMYGFPGEDSNSIEQTAEFFIKIDRPYHSFTTTPLPGTELYRQAQERQLIKNEEGYLMSLTYGYNRFEPIVNLTDFSDEEFILKKINLARRVNRYYYKKHPIAFLKTESNKIYQSAKYQLSDPRRLLKKLIFKLLRIRMFKNNIY